MAKTENETNQAPEEEIRPGVYLADGTYIQGQAGYANGDLWIWTEADSGQTLVGMVTLFADPEKTRIIRDVISERTIQQWEGFTRMTTAKIDEDGIISIRMRRGD